MLTWPVSIVPTGDRDVTELLLNRDGLVLFGPTDIARYGGPRGEGVGRHRMGVAAGRFRGAAGRPASAWATARYFALMRISRTTDYRQGWGKGAGPLHRTNGGLYVHKCGRYYPFDELWRINPADPER